MISRRGAFWIGYVLVIAGLVLAIWLVPAHALLSPSHYYHYRATEGAGAPRLVVRKHCVDQPTPLRPVSFGRFRIVYDCAIGSAPAALSAPATDPAAPCSTLRYRGRVVNVTLFGQELALDGNEAFKALRSGHPWVARRYLRAIHDAYLTFGTRSDGLIHRTYLCGVVG